MSEQRRMKVLSTTLLVLGIVFIVGIYPLSLIWPSGWAWHDQGRSEYFEMILGIYATLGVFLIWASRNPLAHTSLIWFTIWSSIVHAAIMAVQALVVPHHIGHLVGDVLVLSLVAVVLALLLIKASSAKPVQTDQLRL
ncbi:MAG: DUF6632 domain-containing protein [Deinococcota bacterium]